MSPLLAPWLLTLAVEVPCVAALYPGRRLTMGLACALGTSATNLAMNGLLPRWLGAGTTWLVTGEAAALVLEALLYWALARPRDPVRGLTASALANVASFAAGLLLLPPGG